MNAGWKLRRLGEVCEFDKSQGIHSGLPYVGLEDIESQTARFIGSVEPQTVKSSTFKFSTQHVLYGRLRPYLNKVLAPEFAGHCSTEIFPVKPGPFLSREFLLYWFLSEEIVDRINATCTGARMPRADMSGVLDFDFPLPPLPEQQRIVTLLDEAFNGIATARAHAEKNLQNARAIFESQREVLLSLKQDWNETPLAELCDVKHGYAFEGEFFAPEGDYVLLTPGSFFESGGYRERGEKTKYFVGQIPGDYVLDKGDLLVAMTEQAAGLLGSPLLVPESNRFLHNQRLGLVTGKPKVPWLNDFFFHVFNLRRIRQEIHGSASGVKVRHTSPGRIGAVKVAYPKSVLEQSRVTAQLDDLLKETQHLESLYHRKLTALDALKKSLLAQAFSGAL